MKGAARIERFAVFLLTCCENLIHGGIIFGWPSLVFVLKDLGYFSQACSDASENDDDFEAPSSTTTVTIAATSNYHPSAVAGRAPVFCDSQDAQLQLVYSLAVAAQSVCMFPMGFFFDRFGTRLSRMLLSALLLLGYLIVGVSSPETSLLLFPGTILFTIGGALLLLSSAQIGNLFLAHKSTVISVVSSMYSASTIVFFLAKILYENGTSIEIFFFLLAGSVFVLQINTAFFLPRKHIPWPLPENYRLVARDCQRHVTVPVRPDVVPRMAARCAYHNDAYIEAETGELGTKAGDPAGPADCDKGTEIISRQQQIRRASRVVEDRKRLEYPSLRACVLSAPFFMILVYQCILELNMKFMYGSLNFILTRLAGGDDSVVSWYTDMFSFSQFLTLFVSPAGGLLIDRNKLQTPCRKAGETPKRARGPYADVKDTCLVLALASLSSIGCSACLLIPSLSLQYLTFVFIALLRSLLFSSGSAAVFSIFPMEHFASVYGAIRTTSGLVGLLQFPIFIIIQQHLHDDPFYVTIGFIVASALTLIFPLSLFIMARKKSKRVDRPITPIT